MQQTHHDNNFSAWLAWFLCLAFFIYQFLLRLAPGVMMPEMMSQYHMDEASFGLFAACYFLVYALCQIPIGALLDKYSTRLVVTISLATTLIGVYLLIISDNSISADLGRMVIGLGSVAGFLSTAKIIKISFPAEKYARMMGLTYTIGFLGAVYGGKPLSLIIASMGWSKTLELLIIAGIALMLLVFFFLKTEKGDKEIPFPVWVSLKIILRNPFIILIGLSGGLMLGVVEGFGDIWGVNFLQSIYHLDRSAAALAISMIFIGLCAGGYLIAIIADFTKAHYLMIVLCGLAMAAILLILFYIKLPYNWLLLLLFVSGILSCYQVLMFTIVSWIVPNSLAAIAAAMVNMLNMLFGFFFHSLIGILLKWAKNIIPDYAYAIALTPIIIGLLLGSALFFSIISSVKKLIAEGNIISLKDMKTIRTARIRNYISF